MHEDKYGRACLRFGWTALALFAFLGLSLESLHLIKAPQYLDVRMRRELWTLAHAHGALLGVVNIVFGLYARRFLDAAVARASVALRLAGVLIPLGFLAGGIGNTETDPSLPIVLVPLGAIALIAGAYLAARLKEPAGS